MRKTYYRDGHKEHQILYKSSSQLELFLLSEFHTSMETNGVQFSN